MDFLPQTELDWAASTGGRLLAATDPDFPPQLLTIPDPPSLLYVLGNVAILSSPQIALVGSRNATPGGRETAHQFARLFAEAGVTVISGLAVGIDAAGHEGALAGGGGTIAVYGTGL